MKIKPFVLCAFFAVLIALLCACSSSEPPAAETAGASHSPSSSPAAESAPQASADGYPVVITDFAGDTVTIESAERIVSLSSSGTLTLMALDAEDRIVGVDSYSADYLPGVEVVGDYTGPDIEKIVSLTPDVIVAANNIQADAIEQLRSLGLPVVAAEPTSWAQLDEGFAMLGDVVNNRAGADALIAEFDTTVQNAEKAAPSVSPTCYYVLSYGNAGNWTSGEGSFINSLMEYAGGTPVTKGTSYPWLEYPMEDLAAADPDVIILASDAGTIEDFVHTPGYDSLSAVKAGHVYEINADLVDLPCPILNEGLTAVSEIIQEAAVTLASEPAA